MANQTENSYDVIITGAGPAGLSTALHLLLISPAWAGRMLVLEKTAHPRPKLCGGGLTRMGVEILKELGLAWPLPIPQVYIEDARLVYGTRTIHVGGKPQVVIFQRTELDAYLADYARHKGVDIRENEPVRSFIVHDQGVEVHTDRSVYQAKVLVGADGANGVVRRFFNRTEQHPRLARLLEVTGTAEDPTTNMMRRSALFDFTPVRQDLQGYFWDFPTFVSGRPAFNRGVYDARIAGERKRAKPNAILNDSLLTLKSDPAELPLAGYPVHWFSPRSRMAMPRLLLVGDAAGVDPLFGEGIAPSLGYGKVAAGAIQDAFERGNFSFRSYRGHLFGSPVGLYLLKRWVVAWWGYRLCGLPWFMHLVWSIGQILTSIWPPPPPLPEPTLAQPLTASQYEMHGSGLHGLPEK
jgi:flavin-dependent dehydrogenase